MAVLRKPESIPEAALLDPDQLLLKTAWFFFHFGDTLPFLPLVVPAP
jgi:hypothetical protein